MLGENGHLQRRSPTQRLTDSALQMRRLKARHTSDQRLEDDAHLKSSQPRPHARVRPVAECKMFGNPFRTSKGCGDVQRRSSLGPALDTTINGIGATVFGFAAP